MAHTFPLRYFIKGPNKQKFFDFLISELNRSLEGLNKRVSAPWLEHLDLGNDEGFYLGPKFTEFKCDFTNAKAALEKHF